MYLRYKKNIEWSRILPIVPPQVGESLMPDCLYCPGGGVLDDVEYTFFKSDRWAAKRASLGAETGAIAPDNIVGALI